MPFDWKGLRRVDATWYTLFQRSGELVVASAEALHALFAGGAIDERASRRSTTSSTGPIRTRTTC